MKLLVIVALLLFGAGCAHGLTFERARELGCLEACTRFAAETGKTAATGWPLEPNECGCRFDDGTIDVTCERPDTNGACS